MEKGDYQIHIIGGGVSGLIAAINLEKEGFSPTIIEATDRIGGRVKTDIVNGYQLDHGFQVLLDAYPKAQEYLDYASLELQQFKPGAIVFKDGKSQKIGDPLRDISFLWDTIFSNVGSLSDKLKIFKMNRQLANIELLQVFEQEEISTLSHLQSKGFSDRIIDNFFKPFCAGIFLEPDLNTSNRMFDFVYKMFGEGYATLPKKGIGEISEQLKNRLNNTSFIFNTRVKEVTNERIFLENGDSLDSHAAIIATEAAPIVSNMHDQNVSWKSCDNLYFETDTKSIDGPIIGLVADPDTLINNIFFHDSLKMNDKGKKSLLSVTVVREHNLDEEGLLSSVKSELKSLCGIKSANFLKRYPIKQALPDITHLRYECDASETQLSERIFLAGDQQLNGSLNAAMISGERAAQGLINVLQGGIRADGF